MLGIGLSAAVYLFNIFSADKAAKAAAPLHKLLLNRYYIDRLYEKGMRAGALGGKLLGAGGGGFMLFFVEPEKQEEIKKVLSKLLYVPFEFEDGGTRILYYKSEEFSLNVS